MTFWLPFFGFGLYIWRVSSNSDSCDTDARRQHTIFFSQNVIVVVNNQSMTNPLSDIVVPPPLFLWADRPAHKQPHPHIDPSAVASACSYARYQDPDQVPHYGLMLSRL